MRAMNKDGNKHCIIIGSDSLIDRLPSKYWNKEVYEWSHAKSPFDAEQTKYIDVIDDYVLVDACKAIQRRA